MAKKKLKQDEIKDELFQIVDGERQKWNDAVVWVTENVGFRMRQMIRAFRKNYWGVFDEPIDSATNREKTWVPLVQSIVEDVVKNIDIDQKDVNFRARSTEAVPTTEIARAYTKDYLRERYFGETLDETERQLAIDGTVVWKIWKEGKEARRSTVELLNFYIDPTEENIQKAFRVMERAVLTPDQIASMSGWKDTDGITGRRNLDKIDGNFTTGANQTTGEFQDVWELWGKIPEKLLTGNAGDTEYVDAHVVVSGIETGDRRLHLLERNTKTDKDGNPLKPYEELRAAKISGRWYGLGFAERLMALQEYMNTIVNVRKNRAVISQLGLFKIRKGQGITAQMLSRLPSNGALLLNNMDDVEQMPIQEVGPSSYKDEEVVHTWAQRVTSAFSIATGEDLPASTPATNAALQSQSARSAFTMIKEAMGSFIQRVMDRHMLPIIAKNIKYGDIVRISGKEDNYRQLVDRIVAELAAEKMEELYAQGTFPSLEDFQGAIQKAQSELLSKPELFVKTTQDIIAEQLDTIVYVSNEELDVPVTINNLLSMLSAAPEYKDDIIKEVFDLLGLSRPSKSVQPQEAQGTMPQPQGQPSLQQITSEANTAAYA